MSDASPPARRPRRSRGGVTLHDVARLAGVAPITASRAINTPSQVSPEVRARIVDAIAQSGYVPNRLASGLASTRSGLVAAVVPTITGPVFLPTVQALTESLAEHGFQLMLGQAGYDGSREDALLEAIIARRPDGIVLTGIMHSTTGRKRLAASGIPVVETWDLTTTPIDMLVGFSHTDVGRAVADFLIARGRRHLAVISGDDERAARRTGAFIATARAHGLHDVPVITLPSPTTLRAGREAFAALAQQAKIGAASAPIASPLRRKGAKAASQPHAFSDEVDAVFCSSDLLAMGVLIEAQALGYAVPEQLAVIGFGDMAFAADTQPALTSVHINASAIGQHAARFIVERVAGHPVEQRIVDIGFSISERATT